jgi:dipeptidase E
MKLFLTSSASRVLDKIVPFLENSPKDMLVAFIPTASDVYINTPWIDDDRNKLKELGFQIKNVDLKGKRKKTLMQEFSDVDIIFVAGGNTSYLLEQSDKSGFTEIVKNLVNMGVIYIGSSAGSLLAGPNIEVDKIYDDGEFGKILESYEGLGFVDFVVLPHADNPEYKPYLKEIYEQYNEKYDLRKLNDNQIIVICENTIQILEA